MAPQSFTIAQQGAQITRDSISWSPALGQAATVTWAFRASAPTSGTEATGFAKFNTAEVAATALALQEWADVANIKFTAVAPGGYSDAAAILLGNYASGPNTNSAGHAYQPVNKDMAASSSDGDVWMNLSASAYSNLALGTYDFLTLVHEIGHSIGLDHPGTYDAGDNKAATYAANAAYVEDSLQYSIMSYFDANNTGANYTTADGTLISPSTPLLGDIAAAQRLYGANTTTRTGDTTYGFNSTAGDQYKIGSADQQVVFCIYDAGGTNTLDVSGYATNQKINLNEGTFSDVGTFKSNVSIALGTLIQKALGGAGNDTIILNNAGDTVAGGGGNDTINGGTGRDTANFSAAVANYTVTRNGAVITVADGVASRDGTDTLTNVERAHFSDVTLAFDLTGTAGEGYRLYKAAYNRAPDQDGVTYWINNLDKGMSLNAVAQAFVTSAEYKSIYGAAPTPEATVTSFYGNVLGRTPDQAGLDYWIGIYKSGAVTTANLLINFSESAENQANTVALVGNGIALNNAFLV